MKDSIITTSTVVHCFGSYLPATENWAFRLIRNVTGFRQMIASHRFLENDFHAPELECLRPPVQIAGGPSGVRAFADTCLQFLYLHYLSVLLRSARVDIVHSHFANIAWRYRWLAKKLNSTHVVSFYGWDYEHLPTTRPKWKARISSLFSEADVIVCEGPHGASLLARLGCPEGKIRVCRLGIEPEQIPIHHRRKPSGRLDLLQIASFREKKGHIYSVRAFANAKAACPEATLTLVGTGNGPVRHAVEAEIEAAGLTDCIRIVPGIDFAHLHEFMRDFHVFIHPSVHTPTKDCEGGAPVVLLDAQATGMPVISTHHCDIPDEVLDGTTGILVEERDVHALSAAINRFYSMEQSEYEVFSHQARYHVEHNFNAKTCSQRLGEIYAEAIDVRGHRR